MTTTQSGSKMKLRHTDSTAGTGGSIPMGVKSRAKRRVRRLRATLALAVLSLALLALPGQAFAGSTCPTSTDCQYSNEVQQIAAGLGSGPGGGGGAPAQRVAVPAASSGPSLPFTGLDVAALAVVALALTGTGVVLRRLATIGDSEK
jgi:hypothetical protein